MPEQVGASPTRPFWTCRVTVVVSPAVAVPVMAKIPSFARAGARRLAAVRRRVENKEGVQFFISLPLC